MRLKALSRSGARAMKHRYISVMNTPWTTWFEVKGRVHRYISDSRTLCGIQVVDVEKLDRQQAMARIAETDRSACAACDREITRLRPNQNLRTRELTLTPEQQEIRDRLDGEAWRRSRAREDLQRETKSSSSSIRAVSGGLPSLGKRNS